MNEPDQYGEKLAELEKKCSEARAEFYRAQNKKSAAFIEESIFRWARAYKTEPPVGTRVRHIETRRTGVVNVPTQNEAERLAGVPAGDRVGVAWDEGFSAEVIWFWLEPA